MKLGIISNYAPANFEIAAKRNLDFVEFCCNNDEDTNRFIGNVPAIIEESKRTGIPVGSVGRWNSMPNLGADGLDTNVVELIKRNIDAAHAVGSEVFVCGCNYNNGVSLFRNYENAIRYFGELVEYAKQYNMMIAVYNCDWNNFVCNAKQWEVVLGEVPGLMLKFDCSHSFYRGNDYRQELLNWCKRVAHMHIKGSVKINGRGVDDPPAGLDNIDWNTVFAILYREGYDRTLSIEPHSGVWNGELGEKGIDFTVRYMRSLIMK
ncbi:MAG: sugar phosphate isomerase/epimerase [Firmicutes bacterium]|nr:sugar phosphate isomerase/epimerase [Bacillota bacterium]